VAERGRQMDNLKLYREFIKIQIKTTLQYKGAFISGVIAQFFSYSVSFFMIMILIKRFNSLNGWNSYEVVMLYAINLLSYALGAFFFFNLNRNLPRMIQYGELDDILVRPINPLWYIISRDFNTGYMSHLITSIILLSMCILHLHITVTPLKLLTLVIYVIGGALIQGAMLLICSVPTFWMVKNNSITNILFFNIKEFIQYPISIYSKVVQFILTFILPYAFISYYPAHQWLNKSDSIMLSPVLQYLNPVIGVLIMIIAYRFWLFGLKNYKSTGS
jgi:ABC-2 type transport system permease protein